MAEHLTSAAEYLTIREMCDAFDVTPRTLRFYEAKELLAPRREGSRRLYTKRDRRRLRLILRAKRFGISLEDIRQILNLYDGNGDNAAQIARSYAVAKERLAEMERQMAALDRDIADLKFELEAGARMLGTGGGSDAP